MDFGSDCVLERVEMCTIHRTRVLWHHPSSSIQFQDEHLMSSPCNLRPKGPLLDQLRGYLVEIFLKIL